MADQVVAGVSKGRGRCLQCLLVCKRCIGEQQQQGLAAPEDTASFAMPSPQRSMAGSSTASSSYPSIGENVSFGREPQFALSPGGGTVPAKEGSASLDDYQTLFDVQPAEGIASQPAVEFDNLLTNRPTKQRVKLHAVPREVPSTPIPGHVGPITSPASRFGAKNFGFLSEPFLVDVGTEQLFFGGGLTAAHHDASPRPSDGRTGAPMRCNCTIAGSCRACRLRCGNSRKRTVSFAHQVDVIVVPISCRPSPGCKW